MANVVELKAEGWKTARIAGLVAQGQMPITGSSLVSVAGRTRRGRSRQSRRCGWLARELEKIDAAVAGDPRPHAPPCGSVAGFCTSTRCRMLLGDFALQHQDVLLASTRW